jgi:hypothetical protein
MIGKVKEYDFEDIQDAIDRLIASANIDNEYDIVRHMKDIVPEYKSNNSIYSQLD